MRITLGQQVKDSITGYSGTVVGWTLFLYGCERVGIQGPLDKDGKVPDIVWFDEEQVIALPIKRIAKKRGKGSTPAGPRENVTRKAIPNR